MTTPSAHPTFELVQQHADWDPADGCGTMTGPAWAVAELISYADVDNLGPGSWYYPGAVSAELAQKWAARQIGRLTDYRVTGWIHTSPVAYVARLIQRRWTLILHTPAGVVEARDLTGTQRTSILVLFGDADGVITVTTSTYRGGGDAYSTTEYLPTRWIQRIQETVAETPVPASEL